MQSKACSSQFRAETVDNTERFLPVISMPGLRLLFTLILNENLHKLILYGKKFPPLFLWISCKALMIKVDENVSFKEAYMV